MAYQSTAIVCHLTGWVTVWILDSLAHMLQTHAITAYTKLTNLLLRLWSLCGERGTRNESFSSVQSGENMDNVLLTRV